MAKTQGRFTIGDWVIVKAQATFSYSGNKRNLIRISFREPVIGQITGTTFKKTGTRDGVRTYTQYDVEKDYDPPFLIVDQIIPVWEIRLGMKNRPIYATNEDVELAEKHPNRLPWFYFERILWNTGDREKLRDEMKNWPRDIDGRWLKSK